jgi:hypothetical protein
MAIAIASVDKVKMPAPSPEPLLKAEQNTEVEMRDWLHTGEEVFQSEKTRFLSLPSVLYGAQWIKAQKTAALKLTTTDSADVFIAIDSTKGPVWLKGFSDTKESVHLSDGTGLKLYKRRILNKSFLEIGNDATKIVMAVPATSMEPAYDLKPVASYKAVNAKLEGPGLVKGKVDGKDRAIFEKASAGNKVEWAFSVGVADTYSLTVSYNNPLQQVLKGRLTLLAADGTVMKEEEVEFTPTRVGKSNYIDTTTGSMINAGTYFVRLTADEATGLSINALDVQ